MPTGLILRGLIYPLQWQLVTLPVCVGVFDVRMFNLLSCFMFFFLPDLLFIIRFWFSMFFLYIKLKKEPYHTSVNSLLTVYTAASWQYFINLELRTLSTWHSNQQVDGGHYEAEAEMIAIPLNNSP
jgi:hypothetical protein